MTIEINSKDQVILAGTDECEGMFRHGEIAQVLNTAKDWTLDIGWSKSKQKYWIRINGKKFDEMEAVPGK